MRRGRSLPARPQRPAVSIMPNRSGSVNRSDDRDRGDTKKRDQQACAARQLSFFIGETWCFPKKHGLHFAALDGPILIDERSAFHERCPSVEKGRCEWLCVVWRTRLRVQLRVWSWLRSGLARCRHVRRCRRSTRRPAHTTARPAPEVTSRTTPRTSSRSMARRGATSCGSVRTAPAPNPRAAAASSRAAPMTSISMGDRLRLFTLLPPSVLACALLGACSALPPVDEHTGAYQNQVTTGSSIPHKTTDAQSVNKEAFDDRMRFGTNAPTRGGP